MVTLHLDMPYVFLTYAIKDGREWISQTSIFWRHEDVLDFCKEIKNDKSRKLLSVFLLRPAGPGMDTSWAWSPVKEVFAGKYPDCDLDFPLYVTVEGEEYGDTGYFGPHETYESLEQIFPAAKQST
jgi:hypothetical protein